VLALRVGDALRLEVSMVPQKRHYRSNTGEFACDPSDTALCSCLPSLAVFAWLQRKRIGDPGWRHDCAHRGQCSHW
jgi:hypothetical protein